MANELRDRFGLQRGALVLCATFLLPAVFVCRMTALLPRRSGSACRRMASADSARSGRSNVWSVFFRCEWKRNNVSEHSPVSAAAHRAAQTRCEVLHLHPDEGRNLALTSGSGPTGRRSTALEVAIGRGLTPLRGRVAPTGINLAKPPTMSSRGLSLLLSGGVGT